MTRILWQNNTTLFPGDQQAFARVWDVLQAYFKRIGRPDTEVTLQHLDRSTNFVRCRYGDYVNSREVVERLIAADGQGYDAAVIGCMTDSGLYEAREAVSLPITAVAEAPMLMSLALGYRFAIVTVDQAIVPNMEKLVRLYGLESRSINRPVRAVDPPLYRQDYLEAIDDPEKTAIPRFEKVARECIRDGAEVVIIGCGYLGPILSSHGYREISGTGALALDPAAPALKLAESLADLRRSMGIEKSRAGYFKPIPQPLFQQIRRAL